MLDATSVALLPPRSLNKLIMTAGMSYNRHGGFKSRVGECGLEVKLRHSVESLLQLG